MSDPLRSDAAGAPVDGGQIDRDARIEQLLLAGLDHYFTGHYEQAINVWTRVVFLERGHSRARAYIERARGALAEQQRQSEELLHRGGEALNKGDTGSARELINQAVDQHGPSDVAMVLLDRLDRLGAPSAPVGEPRQHVTAGLRPGRHAPVSPVAAPYRPWLVIGALLLAGATGFVLAGAGLDTWFAEGPALRRGAVQAARDEPLPIARPSDMAMSRAQALFEGGHLRDALRTVNAIGIADPRRNDADTLKSQIQRRLLEAARTTAAAPLRPADPR